MRDVRSFVHTPIFVLPPRACGAIALLARAWTIAALVALFVALATPKDATAQGLPYGAPSELSPAVGRLPNLDAPEAISAPPISTSSPPANAPTTSPSAAASAAAPATSPAADATNIVPESALASWYQPKFWIGPAWTGSVEVGMNGSEGNAQAFSMRVGANLKRETPLWTLALEASHARTTADSIETQNNALAKLKADRNLGESPWTLFASGGVEYDEFKAFDLRLSGHAGVGYKFIKNHTTTLLGRLGSGASHEIGGPDDAYVPEALFGLEFEHKLTDKQKLIVKTEYLPEWGDLENYRLVTDASWECLLDAATNLSLKIGAIDRYDSTPNGRRPNDVDYLLLLLWKL